MPSLTIAASLTQTAFQLGEVADLRDPRAATVLGGVVSSTVLTLVVVPVVYTLLDGLTTRVARVRHLRLTFRGARGSRTAEVSRALGPSVGGPMPVGQHEDGHTAANGTPRE